MRNERPYPFYHFIGTRPKLWKKEINKCINTEHQKHKNGNMNRFFLSYNIFLFYSRKPENNEKNCHPNNDQLTSNLYQECVFLSNKSPRKMKSINIPLQQSIKHMKNYDILSIWSGQKKQIFFETSENFSNNLKKISTSQCENLKHEKNPLVQEDFLLFLNNFHHPREHCRMRNGKIRENLSIQLYLLCIEIMNKG